MSNMQASDFTYDKQSVHSNGAAWASPIKGDDQLFVVFDYYDVLNPTKSKQEGVPIYDKPVWVKIIQPGEHAVQTIHREANDSDKMRFPRQWAAFESGRAQVPDGTPLNLLFPDKPNIVASLKHFNILTVQQLANLTGHAIGKIGMGGQMYVNQAQAYLQKAEKGVDYHVFNMEREEQRKENERLTQELAQMKSQMQGLLQSRSMPMETQQPFIPQPQEAPYRPSAPDLSADVVEQPKRRGRPPKNPT